MNQGVQGCYARSMRAASKAVNDYYSEMLRPTGVAVVQFSILLHVEELETCCVGELAEAAELDYTTVARSIKPLIERGLISDRSGHRGRKRCLCLTDVGRAVIATGLPLWKQAQEDVRLLIGSAEIERLQATLARLKGIAG